MHRLWCFLFAGVFGCVMALPFAVHAEQALAGADNAKLITAVEDYRFGDYAPAIKALRELRQRYPKNIEILSTLAAALEESGRPGDALPVLQDWRRLAPEDRDAAMGLARVLGLTGRHAEGADIMQEWLKQHPADVEAMVVEASGRLQAKQYAAANNVSLRILANANASPSQRAAAHYFLAYTAMVQGDAGKAEEQAAKAVAEDAAGVYGRRAKDLLAQIRSGRAGGFGSVAVGGYYTSNASLLPEQLRQNPLLRADPGAKVHDVASQVDLNLGYRAHSLLLSYGLNGVFYSSRKDLNLLPQRVSLGWLHGPWMVAPYYEHVRFGGYYLYHGFGADVAWRRGGTTLSYGASRKTFARGYGPSGVDLSRLGGNAQRLMAQHVWAGNGQRLTLGLRYNEEWTRGDALHAKSDSYRQGGGRVSWWRKFAKADIELGVDGYYRAYRNADTSILQLAVPARRKDRFLRLAAEVVTRPFAHERHALVLDGHWQRNYSNYRPPLVADQNTKTFVEWRLGLAWRWSF